MPEPQLMRFTLKTDTEQQVLSLAPIGWHEFSAEWHFARANFGYNVKLNAGNGGLRFVTDGADFIRRQIDLYGQSAKIQLIVERRKNDWTYEVTFTGGLDLNDNYTNEIAFFEVLVTNEGIKEAVEAKKGVNYEFPLDDTSTEIEVPEGMNLLEHVEYKIDSENDAWFSEPEPDPVFYNMTVFPFMNFKNDVFFKTFGVEFNQQEPQGEGSIGYQYFLNLQSLRDRSQELNINIDCELAFELDDEKSQNIDPNSPVTIQVTEQLNGGAIPNLIISKYDNLEEFKGAKKINFTMPITLSSTPKTYSLVININRIPTGDNSQWNNFYVYFKDGGYFNLKYYGNENTGAFKLKAFDAETLCSKMLSTIYPGSQSSMPFLQEVLPANARLFLTSGDGIRGIPEASVKLKLNEFQTNISCLFGTGSRLSAGQNSYSLVQKKDIFKADTEILDLGVVKNLNIHCLEDEWMFNDVLCGFEKQEYDYILGRQGFTNTLEFKNLIRKTFLQESLVAKYRGDYIGVHLLHYDYINAEKKDSKSDNSVFFILAFQNSETGAWQAVTGDGVTVTGLEGGGYFNVLLSPNRNLRRHSDYLKGILDKLPKTLEYVSSDENLSNMTSNYNSDTVVEKSDIVIDDSVTPLFKPFIFDFDCIVKKNISQILGESPSGYLSFEYNGNKLKGFPIEIDGSITDSEQMVKLIAHPDTPDNLMSSIFKKGFMR